MLRLARADFADQCMDMACRFALHEDGAYDFRMTADAQKARFVCGRAVDDVPYPRKCKRFALRARTALSERSQGYGMTRARLACADGANSVEGLEDTVEGCSPCMRG